MSPQDALQVPTILTMIEAIYGHPCSDPGDRTLNGADWIAIAAGISDGRTSRAIVDEIAAARGWTAPQGGPHRYTAQGAPISSMRDKLHSLHYCLTQDEVLDEDAMAHLMDLVHHLAPGWKYLGLEGIEAIRAHYGKHPAPIQAG